MDFYSLLEKTTRLQITILDTIYHSNKIWSIEQLAEFTACDKRSVQNYCEQVRTLSISDQLRKYQFGFSRIDSVHFEALAYFSSIEKFMP